MFKQIYVCPPKRTGQRYRFFLKDKNILRTELPQTNLQIICVLKIQTTTSSVPRQMNDTKKPYLRQLGTQDVFIF